MVPTRLCRIVLHNLLLLAMVLTDWSTKDPSKISIRSATQRVGGKYPALANDGEQRQTLQAIEP